MSADEQERAEAEAVEKARRDMVARLRSAEMKGLTEGRAEGQLGIVNYIYESHSSRESELSPQLAGVTRRYVCVIRFFPKL